MFVEKHNTGKNAKVVELMDQIDLSWQIKLRRIIYAIRSLKTGLVFKNCCQMCVIAAFPSLIKLLKTDKPLACFKPMKTEVNRSKGLCIGSDMLF